MRHDTSREGAMISTFSRNNTESQLIATSWKLYITFYSFDASISLQFSFYSTFSHINLEGNKTALLLSCAEPKERWVCF